METVVHFVLPLIAALAARIHMKHGIKWVFALAMASVLLDLDHFIGVPRATLHNVFVTFLIPIILIILAFKFEPRAKTKYKELAVANFLFLAVHPIQDLFDGLGIQAFYPLSNHFYNFSNFAIKIAISTGKTVYIAGPQAISVIIFFAVIAFAFYLEEVVQLMHKHNDNLRRALGLAIKEEEKEIEKEL